MKVRLTNLTITCDVELLDGPLLPTTPIPPIVVVVPPVVVPDPIGVPPVADLPAGYATDVGVARGMFFAAMTAAGLDPVKVQGHGAWIVAALKARYPALDVYLSTKDAPVWPGLGSFDATIDSGKGGWSFRLDRDTAWQPVGSR
jgi:hypothetical protein